MRILPLPEAVDNVNLDETARVLVERIHEKLDVVQVVEVPALGDKRITEEIIQRDGIDVLRWGQVSYRGEMEGRRDQTSVVLLLRRWRANRPREKFGAGTSGLRNIPITAALLLGWWRFHRVS